MDIISDRKSVGELTGSVLVNGAPRGPEFLRKTAYVPQVRGARVHGAKQPVARKAPEAVLVCQQHQHWNSLRAVWHRKRVLVRIQGTCGCMRDNTTTIHAQLLPSTPPAV